MTDDRDWERNLNSIDYPSRVRMETLRGDIWLLATTADAIVIPTNVGWTNAGRNVMGRGLAKQAKARYPGLAEWYGAQCMQHQSATPTMLYESPDSSKPSLFLFPTKHLNTDAPHRSWQGRSDLYRIHWSMQRLKELVRDDFAFSGAYSTRGAYASRFDHVLVPLVGCGNGGLDEALVMPILEMFWDHKMRLVRFQ